MLLAPLLLSKNSATPRYCQTIPVLYLDSATTCYYGIRMPKRQKKLKNPTASEMGKKGADSLNKRLTPEERSESARRAGLAGGRGRKKWPA
jgi:hypothetical protein